MRFWDWKLKGEAGVLLCSWTSRRYAVPSIYRAATPQGAVIVTQTIMKHSEEEMRRKQRLFSALPFIWSIHCTLSRWLRETILTARTTSVAESCPLLTLITLCVTSNALQAKWRIVWLLLHLPSPAQWNPLSSVFNVIRYDLTMRQACDWIKNQPEQ